MYRLPPCENHESGFPLATLSFTSHGVLKDRVYRIKETLFHDPYMHTQSQSQSQPMALLQPARRLDLDGYGTNPSVNVPRKATRSCTSCALSRDGWPGCWPKGGSWLTLPR